VIVNVNGHNGQKMVIDKENQNGKGQGKSMEK
jgi:hypothetical protein